MFKSFINYIAASIFLGGSGATFAGSFPHSCQVGTHMVEMVAHGDYPDMQSFTLSIDGDQVPAFEQLNGEDYVVGSMEFAACTRGVYVAVVNYGPPYMKGFALRANPRTKELERLDFAEKSVPKYVVSRNVKFEVVLPNEDAGPHSRYIIYQFEEGKQLQSIHQDNLPGNLIRLR